MSAADEATSGLSDDVIERLTSALGNDLLEFVLNCPVRSLTDGTASATSMTFAEQLNQSLLQEVEGETNVDALAAMLKFRLTDTVTDPQTLALSIHQACGGAGDAPAGLNAAEDALVRLARDVYPSFLLPDDQDTVFPRWAGLPPIRVTSALFRHPLRERFEAELMNDRHISKAFAHTGDATSTYAMVMASTGRGGSVHLEMLATQILNTAWQGPRPTLAEFIDRSLEQLRFVYAAFAKENLSVAGRLSFAGVLLPSDEPYDFGDVLIRAAKPLDHELLPESLKGQLSGSDSAGQTTTINYAGDVLAELRIPYEIRTQKHGLGSPPQPIPDDLLAIDHINDVSTRLRASLLLAADREHRVQVALSWQAIDDPINGISLSWSQPERFVGLMPTMLTDDEISRWAEWYRLISSSGADRISLAISRVVRAASERRDPIDVLIDSVIAWENLFGTKDGEPTLRVTASLALLLEPDPAKRRAARSEFGKIYGLRSNAVHGTSLPKSSEMHLCYRALDVAIAAIRALIKDRPDILAEPDGGSRSLRLILGEGRNGEEDT